MAWDPNTQWQRHLEEWWPRFWSPSSEPVEVLTDEVYHKYMKYILSLDLASLTVTQKDDVPKMYAPPSSWLIQLIRRSICRKSRPSPESVERICKVLFKSVKLIADNVYGRHLISIKSFQCFVASLIRANNTINALGARWYNTGYYRANDSLFGDEKCYLVRSIDTNKKILDEIQNVRQPKNISITYLSALTGRLVGVWVKESVHEVEFEYDEYDKHWHSTSDAYTTDELFTALNSPWTAFPEK
jgi:hypothetical protein